MKQSKVRFRQIDETTKQPQAKQRSLLISFAIRLAASMLGLWIAEALLGSFRITVYGSFGALLGAGLLLALFNTILKPILVIFSFPAIILTLGLFMLVLNGFVLMLVSWIYSGLYIKNFGVAIVAGIIVGLVNYLVTRIVKDV